MRKEDRSYSSSELRDLKKKNLLFIKENQVLQDRIISLEARLANLEKREESYRTDENKFTFPRKEESDAPKGQYKWMLKSRKAKKRKVSNSPKIMDLSPDSNLPSKHTLPMSVNSQGNCSSSNFCQQTQRHK